MIGLKALFIKEVKMSLCKMDAHVESGFKHHGLLELTVQSFVAAVFIKSVVP